MPLGASVGLYEVMMAFFSSFSDRMTLREAFETRRKTSIFFFPPRNGFKADVAHYSCASKLRGSSDTWTTSLREQDLGEQKHYLFLIRIAYPETLNVLTMSLYYSRVTNGNRYH